MWHGFLWKFHVIFCHKSTAIWSKSTLNSMTIPCHLSRFYSLFSMLHAPFSMHVFKYMYFFSSLILSHELFLIMPIHLSYLILKSNLFDWHDYVCFYCGNESNIKYQDIRKPMSHFFTGRSWLFRILKNVFNLKNES